MAGVPLGRRGVGRLHADGQAAEPGQKPAAICCQAVLTWSNKVHYAPDTVNGGVPTPGLVGRLYLFGDRIDYPLVGDGSLIVDLYNDTSGTPAEQPLERWHIDADTMQRLLRRDTIGWGYTLFLPWSSCKPEITRVRLTARFDPRHGSPLFAPTSTVTLEHPGPAAAAGGTSPDAPRLLPPLGPPQSPVPPVRPSQAARR